MCVKLTGYSLDEGGLAQQRLTRVADGQDPVVAEAWSDQHEPDRQLSRFRVGLPLQ